MNREEPVGELHAGFSAERRDRDTVGRGEEPSRRTRTSPG